MPFHEGVVDDIEPLWGGIIVGSTSLVVLARGVVPRTVVDGGRSWFADIVLPSCSSANVELIVVEVVANWESGMASDAVRGSRDVDKELEEGGSD